MLNLRNSTCYRNYFWYTFHNILIFIYLCVSPWDNYVSNGVSACPVAKLYGESLWRIIQVYTFSFSRGQCRPRYEWVDDFSQQDRVGPTVNCAPSCGSFPVIDILSAY